jgi:hypothetical protein
VKGQPYRHWCWVLRIGRRMLDEASGLPGTKHIMLTFDDFQIRLDQFGERIQPLMRIVAAS